MTVALVVDGEPGYELAGVEGGRDAKAVRKGIEPEHTSFGHFDDEEGRHDVEW